MGSSPGAIGCLTTLGPFALGPALGLVGRCGVSPSSRRGSRRGRDTWHGFGALGVLSSREYSLTLSRSPGSTDPSQPQRKLSIGEAAAAPRSGAQDP
jgi:hypothetical protein